jgi:hypothetical protein
MDKFWVHVIGKPESAAELDGSMRKHEDALVRLGFLQRETFAMETQSMGEQAREITQALRSECPWQHVQAMSETNMTITACAYGMEQWRKRAQEFGWKCRAKG